jgi:hypothetical protein
MNMVGMDMRKSPEMAGENQAGNPILSQYPPLSVNLLNPYP